MFKINRLVRRTHDGEQAITGRPRGRILVTVALATLVFAGVPATASAQSWFGQGYAHTQLYCNQGQITVQVSMYGHTIGHLMARDLYQWKRATPTSAYSWVLIAAGTVRPDGISSYFDTRVNVVRGTTTYFQTYYYWAWNGVWRSGSPAYEQTAIYC